MSAPPTLTESDIRRLAASESFARGEGYYASGAVSELQKRGNTLTARVAGSQYEPYRVTITVGPSGIEAAECTCPYDWGGVCKHVVATLLAWVREPDSTESLPSLDEQLAGHSREDLITIVKTMIAQQPDLARLLDLPLRPDSPVPLDLAAFRKQLRYALSREDAEWVGRELGRLHEMADGYLEAGKTGVAGALYHLITQETLSRFQSWWLEGDEDGDISRVLGDCAQGLDLCLDQISDPETRRPWLEALLDAHLEDVRLGGMDFAWPAGDVVLRRATDTEWAWIEDRLRQEIQRARDWGRGSLVSFLTARLQATGQDAQADALILEQGTPRQQAFRLLELGRVDESIDVARQYFADFPGLVTDYADALVDAGHGAKAAAYMTEQLAHERCAGSYRPWLARYSEEHGEPKTALAMWRLQFEERPSFEAYKHLRRLAGGIGAWASLRPAMLGLLDPIRQAWLQIEIALDERDVAWAIEIVSRPGAFLGQDGRIRVATAAEASHPKAAAGLYHAEAERLIAAQGRANYVVATEHLLRVRDLHRRLGEEAAWAVYVARLRQEHRRLRALREELDRVGL
jgi:hypothetical protein